MGLWLLGERSGRRLFGGKKSSRERFLEVGDSCEGCYAREMEVGEAHVDGGRGRRR